MIDANTQALNKHLDKENRRDSYLEIFRKGIDSTVQSMEDLYYELRMRADNFGGYDFSEELKEEIENRLNISLKDKK